MSMGSKGVLSDLVTMNAHLETIKKTLTDIGGLTTGISGSASSLTKATSPSGAAIRGGSGPMPSGSLGGFSTPSGAAMGSGGGSLLTGALRGIGNLVPGLVTAAASAMPDVGSTLNYATGYFNASVGQGGAGSTRRVMQSTTLGAFSNGGLTGAGNDAAIAQALTRAGIQFSSASGSNYMNTLNNVAMYAKTLNIDNGSAVQALTGMQTGQFSMQMMRQLGIYTSNPANGKQYSTTQMFGQLANRLEAGRPAPTVAGIMASYQRGNLGASLAGLGLSDTQQQMFVQYLKDQAGGKTPAGVDQLQAEIAKNNPQAAVQNINASTSMGMNTVSDAYIQGLQQAAPLIKDMNQALSLVPKSVAAFYANVATLQGTRQGGAAISALSQVGGSLLSGVGSMVGSAAGSRLGTSKAGSVLGTIGKSVGKAGIGGLLAVGSGMASNYAKSTATGGKGIDPLAASLAIAGGAGSGALIGAAIPFLGETGIGEIGGAVIGGLAAAANTFNWFGGAGGAGGTVSAGGTTGNTPKNAPTFNPPVNPAIIVQGYGPRKDPLGAKTSDFHHGVDFKAAMGTPVMASADGTVASAGWYGELGNCVQIDHADGYRTLYGHNSRMTVTAGTAVKQGQVVAFSGTTGRSSGPHCHLGVMRNGSFIDPATVLSGTASKVQPAGTPAKAASTGSNNSTPSAGLAPDVHSLNTAISSAISAISDPLVSSAMVNTVGVGNQTSSSTISASNKPSGTGGDSNAYGLGGGAGGGTGTVQFPGITAKPAGSSTAVMGSPTTSTTPAMSANGAESKSRSSNQVTIQVTLQNSSDSEAMRLVNIVKKELEKDTIHEMMGSR